jgi:hypothetical protein
MIRFLIQIEQTGKIMRTARFLMILAVALGVFAATADAQRRKTTTRRTTTTKKPPTTVKPALTAEVIVAKTKVSNQLFNVNAFVDKLGPIAQGIESVDGEAKTKRLKKSILDENAANKQGVIQAIRGLKTGLVNLETEFRTKPDLRKFLVSIQGISDLAAQSEDAAIAGRFVASKDPLRTVAKKLGDTLAVMP